MLKDKEGERLETMPEDQFTSPTAIASLRCTYFSGRSRDPVSLIRGQRERVYCSVESVPYLGRAQSIPSISKAGCSVTELRLKEDQTKRFQSDLNQSSVLGGRASECPPFGWKPSGASGASSSKSASPSNRSEKAVFFFPVLILRHQPGNNCEHLAGEFFKAENPIHQEQTEVEEDCPKVVFPSLLKVQLGEAKNLMITLVLLASGFFACHVCALLPDFTLKSSFFACKWQASYSYGSMVNDFMLERMVFRRISGGCLIDIARKLGAARAVIGKSIVSSSSLSLKVLKMQSYKYSFSK
ncbi:hypothetical protein P8452_51772 [Trifolium repens]|nr:hypothetical protein P8452_51772 [Trifolium repens]